VRRDREPSGIFGKRQARETARGERGRREEASGGVRAIRLGGVDEPHVSLHLRLRSGRGNVGGNLRFLAGWRDERRAVPRLWFSR